MVTGKPDTTKTATDTPPAFLPPIVNTQVLKIWTEIPARSYKETLDFAASRFRAQADFCKALAACETPAEAWKHQVEYAQGFLRECSQESARTFKAVQDSFASASSWK